MMWTPVLLAVLGTAAASPVTKRTTASEWNSLGCVKDSNDNRVLQDKVYAHTENSPDLCVETCESKGYTYAGVQCE